MTWIRAHAVEVGTAVLGSTIALVIAAFFFFLQEESTSLSVVLLANTNLVSDEAKASDRISILFEENVIPELWFASLELVNSGDTAITRSDFDGPITLRLVDGAILEVIKGENSPTELQPELIQTRFDTVTISPMLLNAGDSVAFSLFATKSMDRLTPAARIARVKVLNLTSSVPATSTGNIRLWIVVSLGATVVLAFAVLLFTAWVLRQFQRAIRRGLALEMVPDDQGHLEQP